MTFEEFITSSTAYPTLSLWIVTPGLKIYMRKGIRERDGDFVIANINATKPGRGALTSFLAEHSMKYRFSFELVLNPRLVGYLKRHGYRIVDELSTEQAPTMLAPSLSTHARNQPPFVQRNGN